MFKYYLLAFLALLFAALMLLAPVYVLVVSTARTLAAGF